MHSGLHTEIISNRLYFARVTIVVYTDTIVYSIVEYSSKYYRWSKLIQYIFHLNSKRKNVMIFGIITLSLYILYT